MIFYIDLVADPVRPVPVLAPARPRPLPKLNLHAKALYDYRASETDEISLNAGERLIVLRTGTFYTTNKFPSISRFQPQQDLL